MDGPEKQEQTPEEIAAALQEVQQATQLRIYTRDDTGHDLTVEEFLFVRSYIIDRNEVAALRRLGYAGSAPELRKRAKKYLASPEVQYAIDTIVKKVAQRLEVTAEKVIGRLAAMAFFDPRSVLSFDHTGITMLPSELWPDEAIAAISGVKMTKDAGVEVKFVDPLRATEVLGKQLNLLQDPDENDRKLAAEAAASSAINKMVEVMDRVAARSQELAETEEQRTIQ